jgi:hypothetical protein
LYDIEKILGEFHLLIAERYGSPGAGFIGDPVQPIDTH